MTDTVADTPELEPAVTFDSAALIAAVRRGDQTAIEEAYRLTFGTRLGRTVLLHALATLGGVGQPRTAESADHANYRNGRASVPLEMAGLAGFDPVAVAAAGLTQTLEGASYEHGYGRSDHHHEHDGPGIVFDDAFTGGADDDSRTGDPGGFDHGD